MGRPTRGGDPDLTPRVPPRLRRALLPVYQHAIRQTHELSYLFIELTARCQLACRHCGSDCKADPAVADLSLDDVVRVLDEIRGAWDPRGIWLVLSGGEPLAWRPLWDLADRVHAMGFPWGMVTNGWAWNDAAFERARAAGMRSVAVSLDGLEEDHDWLRGRPGSFARASATLRRLAADPSLEVVDAITCVTPRVLPRLDDVREHVRSLGLRRWRVFTICPIGRAASDPELQLDRAGYQALMRKILAIRAEEAARPAGDGLVVNLSDSGYQGPHLEHRVRDFDYFCLAGIRVAGIMVNGDFLACPNIDRRFRQGNLHSDSFVDTWEHRYEAFRDRRWMRTGACASCSEWRQCQGNDLHLWDLDRNETRLCHYHQYGLADPVDGGG